MGDVGAEDVAVEMKVCAVNPADINGIQGEYQYRRHSRYRTLN